MMYAYSENYILPLSHDEVVHGKGSLINKMYGSYEQKFASLKLLYAFMYAHPGKKLLFMGGEFGQFIEWRFAEQLDWMLLGYDSHAGLHRFVRDLNNFYKSSKSMYENDTDWDGFKWINETDSEHSVISFMRISRSKREKTIVAANFAAQAHKGYEIGVPSAGRYEIVLNTDSAEYGGSCTESRIMTAKKNKTGSLGFSISLDLPELSAVYIRKVRQKSR